MFIKGYEEENFGQYKKPCMFIGTPKCDFKCDRECGGQVCQNSDLAKTSSIEVAAETLIKRYKKNSLTSAIVLGGLEPFDTITDTLTFVSAVRASDIKDDIVIYTGYTEEELNKHFFNEMLKLKQYSNIYLKVGRFVPNQEKHYDKVLGVYLASDNQYGLKIS